MVRRAAHLLALAPILAVVLVLQACGGDDPAPTGPDSDPDPDPATDATVEGTVTEHGTGHGLADVVVSGVRTDTDEALFEDTTDASGTYAASFEVTEAPDEVRVSAEPAQDGLGIALDSLSFTESITADFELAWKSPFSNADDEDCLPLDPENLEIAESGGRFVIMDGEASLVAFDEFEAAQDGLDIIQFHGFTQQCFVNRPDPPMEYWLIDGTPPKGSDDVPVNEDCISVDPELVEIEEFGEQWRIVEGEKALLLFDELAAAQDGRDIIQFYGLTQMCFVNRPDPPMTYWTR